MNSSYFSFSTKEILRIEKIWREIDKFGIVVGEEDQINLLKEHLSKHEEPNRIFEIINDEQFMKMDLNLLIKQTTIFIRTLDSLDKDIWNFLDQIGKRGRLQPPFSDRDIKVSDDLRICVFLTPAALKKSKSNFGRNPRGFSIYKIMPEEERSYDEKKSY
jgi:hypothetical protein